MFAAKYGWVESTFPLAWISAKVTEPAEVGAATAVTGSTTGVATVLAAPSDGSVLA